MSQKKEKYARELGRRMSDAEYRLSRLEDAEVVSGPDDAFEEHLIRERYYGCLRNRIPEGRRPGTESHFFSGRYKPV